MNYRARYINVNQASEQDETQHRDNDSSEDSGDIFQAVSLSNKGTSQFERIHPMDVQMAVFHCADGFLKQLMVTKLSQCQYALPLLVPDPFTQQIEFPLWTFRQINKSWKMRNNNNEIISYSQPIYKAETQMAFFFRFGSVSSSKSHLMNSLINEKHHTFFHRNCPGSSRNRVLMDGVVEIAWFCPSGKYDDKFTECVGFCNLHGDAGDHEKQLQILTEMASVNVIFLPQLDKNDRSAAIIQNLYTIRKPLICIFSEDESSVTEMKKGKFKIGLKDRNQSDVSEELRRTINDCLSESSFTFRLEDVSKHSDIRVDEEDDDDCRRGREAAQQMMTLLEKKDLTETKESFLPHQGKLWHQWSHEKISVDLQAAAFGVEHIMREISQIYESCSSVKKNKKDLKIHFSSLPCLAAEMMMSGFPLELMDGDAAHVPVIWISAVLDQLIQKLGDQRVFVLSVLGIQSSGKSTMLNAMFGLQFAVSAGRCTRGAFMQLVKVSDEMKTLLNFDYILVVETEGLPALELAGRSTRHHDNELATFVVGIGNLTLINIFGENPSEMQDTLQIVVQAFMRMKKNVSDVTAEEKNMEGKRRLQQILDEMTKLAAKDEDNDAECFSDVMEFDIQKDTTNGNTKPRLLKLETEYSKWSWSLRRVMMETENKLHNKIENEAVHEIEETDLQEELKKTREEVEKSISTVDHWRERENKMITDQHRMFREANDPVIYVERKREEYYSIFQKYCHKATSAAIFGKIICQKLKEPTEQSVYKKTARDLTDEMRSNCESLNGNRSNLEKHILKTLAEEEDFDKYMNYIKTPRDHFRSFIRDEVSRYMTDKFSVSVLPKMKENIKLLQQKLMKAAHESTEHVQVNRGDVGLWLKSFAQQLSEVLIFSEKDLSGVKHDDFHDFNLLEDVIKQELTALISDITSRFSIEIFTVKLDYKFRPDELLIDHFCQCCWVQCPFCGATCTNTIENHDGDHSVDFHRVICPDLSKLPYWKWFVYRFKDDLEKHYNKTFERSGEITDEWRKYSKQEAIESLDEYI
ncbi:hypothetical protein M9458_007384 [Cirrhinus mrigala]|uniref:VLIG-type G domain-containing protein n=1 Tax=Cirrhinus mrigala TaxID=683832 RepID=A0ABD0RJX9_CIRMR